MEANELNEHYKNMKVEPFALMGLLPMENLTVYQGFLIGNIFKYGLRAGSKNTGDANYKNDVIKMKDYIELDMQREGYEDHSIIKNDLKPKELIIEFYNKLDNEENHFKDYEVFNMLGELFIKLAGASDEDN